MSSRRSFLGLMLGGAGGAAVGPGLKIWSKPAAGVSIVSSGVGYTSAPAVTMAELAAVTRKAFLPKVAAQIYSEHPFLSLLPKSGKWAMVMVLRRSFNVPPGCPVVVAAPYGGVYG